MSYVILSDQVGTTDGFYRNVFVEVIGHESQPEESKMVRLEFSFRLPYFFGSLDVQLLSLPVIDRAEDASQLDSIGLNRACPVVKQLHG